MALSVLYTFILPDSVVQIKIGGAFMNSFEYQDRIDALLTKLEKEMPEADRLIIIHDLRELLSAFFVC